MPGALCSVPSLALVPIHRNSLPGCKHEMGPGLLSQPSMCASPPCVRTLHPRPLRQLPQASQDSDKCQLPLPTMPDSSEGVDPWLWW